MKSKQQRCFEAFEALGRAGLFGPVGNEGWYCAVRPPRTRELPWFVTTLVLLGSCPRYVETKDASVTRPLDTWFRLKKPPT